ncbi:MAG: hypothetical protein JW947_07615 [Sedimentisphaerales bacterium]|nr:hypothetical protein [Sedimentisphaerales bacterium]
MKIRKPSPTFIILASAAFAVFFGALTYQRYTWFRTDRNLTREVLTSQRQTEHFHIYSNLDEATLDYYEQFFEGFFEYFSREYFEITQKRPLKVFLFSDTESYTPYAKSCGCDSQYGFYMGPRENIIVVNHESGLGTTTHELVHHFIAISFASKHTKWVDEGIATFFEKFIGHLDNEGKLTISFGYFNNWRFPATKVAVKFFNLSEIIKAKEPDECAARSLMLFLHKKGLFKNFVREISTIKNDWDGSATLQKVYGKSTAEIESEWKEWIKAQPIDEDVMLVESAFVLSESQWQEWWRANQNRLYWSEEEQIYRVIKPRAKVSVQ